MSRNLAWYLVALSLFIAVAGCLDLCGVPVPHPALPGALGLVYGLAVVFTVQRTERRKS